MKRKQIEQVPMKEPKGDKRKKQHFVSVQLCGDYLILDLWSFGTWIKRHAVDTQTGEYGSYGPDMHWTGENLEHAFCTRWSCISKKSYVLSKEDRKLLKDILKIHWDPGDVYYGIRNMEYDYSLTLRERKEDRRVQRINSLMGSVDAAGKTGRELYSWIEEKIAGSLQYAIWHKQKGVYHCTACGSDFTQEEAGIRMKHNGAVPCPLCGQTLTVEKRRTSLQVKTYLTLIHGLDRERGIQRHFAITIEWNIHRVVKLHETIRRILPKGVWKKDRYNTYYAQSGGWDNGNPFGLKWYTGYLYPEGIREGLEGTAYRDWAEVFSYMAQMGIRANYTGLMYVTSEAFIRTAEYLAKGRFYRLLKETSEKCGCFREYGTYGLLNIDGTDIRDTMRIRDMQKINRLRQEDGGEYMLEWLQWADREGKRISSEVLAWYAKNKIHVHEYAKGRAAVRLSPEQLMHYIERQAAESYDGRRKAAQVFEIYRDYLSMAEKLGKDLSDQMVYRPRELKRRHGELVEEHGRYLEARRNMTDEEKAREAAAEMEEQYPGSGAVLAEIKPQYEYEGERFRITVPASFYEITREGMALHHCVGYTERYFDRILQHETYICFLRRREEPEKPFYTIEVEPGGTIRQHRGMYDMEPDIEEIKPFLQEWQREIRKRMRAQDHERARISAIRREENLDELRQKGNTRVLEALMEDLMEVV